jgi:uncharacterized membrane protein
MFYGVVAAIVVSFIAAGVGFFREVEARNQQTTDAFKEACESTGGKAVWNFKYWECLK